ncbi:MAG: DUF4143 domain-containing protein [Solirubrobacteraceae bacterium]
MSYRDALERLWIIDDVPAWQPGLSHFVALLQQPKRHLVDPALAAVLLGVTAEKPLSGEPLRAGSSSSVAILDDDRGSQEACGRGRALGFALSSLAFGTGA